MSLACKEQAPENRNKEKPNIVFILADDLGVYDLSSTGSTLYETPNIDRIGKEGMTFTRGYAASRVCSPSRASILTGKFTARHGVTDWIGALSGKEWTTLNRHDKLLPASYMHQIPQEDITLAEALKKEGYITFFAGKWHLGGQGSYPEEHGFDVNVGGWEKGSPVGGYFSPWENPNLENKRTGEQLSMRLAEETANFMAENKGVPFFAFLSFYAVHGPIQTSQAKWRKYRDKVQELGVPKAGFKMERRLPVRIHQDNPVYAGLVEHMDEAVGLVLQALDSLGLSDDTIVIFTSDNGGVASGDSFSTSNLPLRGGKGYQWEGGLREPYMIKVPWITRAGAFTDYPVSGVDFYPTILDLAGIDLLPAQHEDGISLKPLLEGKDLKINRPLYWHYPHYGNQGGEPSSIIQEDGWKLIHYYEDQSDELYDLGQDIGEQINLSAKFPERTARMRKKLRQWLLGVGAKMPVEDLSYDPVLAGKRKNMIVNELWPSLESGRMEMLSDDFSPNEDWWGSTPVND
jgi:arylsulfatase A-like enzyme